MNRIILFALLMIIVSCSDDGEESRTMYNVKYTVTATDGATINKVEYRDGKGDLIELSNVSSPWTISIQVRAGLGLEAAAYGDVPYQGSLGITAVWAAEGGQSQSETSSLSNDTPNSTINNGKVDIPGRTLPD